jgi:hypothetical protein
MFIRDSTAAVDGMVSGFPVGLLSGRRVKGRNRERIISRHKAQRSETDKDEWGKGRSERVGKDAQGKREARHRNRREFGPVA